MRKFQFRLLLLAVMFPLALAGCGSSGSGGDQTAGPDAGVDPDTGIAFVSAAKCVECHQDISFSNELVADYLTSKHVIHSDSITAASPAFCLECHDPVGEEGLAQFLDPANVPAEGLAAVGCEACHGAGGEHFGVGPVPNVTPDYAVCGECHNALPDSHIPNHPFADNILDNYLASEHAQGRVRDSSPCFRCHSDEGFRQYIGSTFKMDGDELSAALASVIPPSTVTAVQCRTCHDPHSGELRTPEEDDRLVINDNHANREVLHPVVFSKEFNLCTSCHQVPLNADPILSGDPAAGTESFDGIEYSLSYNSATMTGRPYHALDPGDIPTVTADADRVIWDTHFAYDGNGDGDTLDTLTDPPTDVAGYNINAGQENACTQCHDPHAASKFEQTFASGIAEEWGNEPGFHGDYQAEAFNHGFDETDGECMQCHHGTEAVKIFAGLPALDADGESNLEGQKAVVVACVTCHDLTATDVDDIDADLDTTDIYLGYLRDLKDADGVATTVYTFPSGESVDLGADDSANGLCLTCHSGRESKVSITEELAASPGPYSFINIHYRAAGASLFGNFAKGAFEYEGKTYAAKNEHVASNDLCVECHNVHSGELFLSSPGFGPTGCNNCHTAVADTGNYAADILTVRDIRMNGSLADYDGDGNTIEGVYYEIYGSGAGDGLDELLLAEIENYALNIIGVGIQYDPSAYPYFFKLGAISYPNRYTDFDAALLKAAYNYQFVQKDPGTYAHNPAYIIEILYDSIEALGGNVTGLTRDDSGHFNASAEAFRHWDEDGEMSTSCARCHSSEGAQLFFADGTVTKAETVALTEFNTYTQGIASNLGCESCHLAPFDGTLRDINSVEFPNGFIVDATTTNGSDPLTAGIYEADNSTICMSCHQGRASGQTVIDAIAASDFGFINRHYFAAAAIMFGSNSQAHYEYPTRSYRGTNGFTSGAHVGLRTCAECHLDPATDPTTNHDFLPELATCFNAGACHTDSTGASAGTSLTSFDLIGLPTIANNVDYDGDGTAEGFQGEIDGLSSRLYTQLQVYATAQGAPLIYDGNSYPYFFNDTNGNGAVDAGEAIYPNRYQDFDATSLPAAYNYKAAQDPCGAIHNHIYVIQALYDTLDQLDNGAQDDSISATRP